MFIDLVYQTIPLDFNWNLPTKFLTLYHKKTASNIVENTYTPIIKLSPEDYILELRAKAKSEITHTAIHLLKFTFDTLLNVDTYKLPNITSHHTPAIVLKDSTVFDKNLNVPNIKISKWIRKGSLLAQLSQHYVSPNWHQGGNTNIAVLGILTGQLDYDDKQGIQWESDAEWRLGFYSVDGDTLHNISTNDDILKISSKIGIKAEGNWFYSSSIDFSTPFFSSFKGINSMQKKAAFFTPVKFNVNFGFDYKYKKVFSLMLSPISYKYVYVMDNITINPNLFGITTGEKSLGEVGSSCKAILSYQIVPEILLDAKLLFYTNYQKVEVDLEMVFNMTINRFMSARMSFNPRYDNTVISSTNKLPTIQFKQLISVGFSHTFK